MSVKVHGKITLPKGAFKRTKAAMGRHWRARMQRYDVVQGELEKDLADTLLTRTFELFGEPLPVIRREEGWLAFKKVSEHRDDWPKMHFGAGRAKAVSFLHICLSGKARLKTAAGEVAVKRGDVFSLNPNATHAVPSSTLCVTACFTVPRAAVRAAKSLSL